MKNAYECGCLDDCCSAVGQWGDEAPEVVALNLIQTQMCVLVIIKKIIILNYLPVKAC